MNIMVIRCAIYVGLHSSRVEKKCHVGSPGLGLQVNNQLHSNDHNDIKTTSYQRRCDVT